MAATAMLLAAGCHLSHGMAVINILFSPRLTTLGNHFTVIKWCGFPFNWLISQSLVQPLNSAVPASLESVTLPCQPSDLSTENELVVLGDMLLEVLLWFRLQEEGVTILQGEHIGMQGMLSA